MRCLIILTKSPHAADAKSRLAPALGKAGAQNAHATLLERTLRCTAGPWTSRLAVTHLDAATRRWAEDCELAIFEQTGPGLGARMLHALTSCLTDADAAVLIGSDCPLLDVDYISRAFAALAHSDVVFGPAEDGGYVLVGMREPQPAVLTDEIPWGTSEVHAVSCARAAAAGLAVTSLEPVWDVDTPEDWQRFLDLLDVEGVVR